MGCPAGLDPACREHYQQGDSVIDTPSRRSHLPSILGRSGDEACLIHIPNTFNVRRAVHRQVLDLVPRPKQVVGSWR